MYTIHHCARTLLHIIERKWTSNKLYYKKNATISKKSNQIIQLIVKKNNRDEILFTSNFYVKTVVTQHPRSTDYHTKK